MTFRAKTRTSQVNHTDAYRRIPKHPTGRYTRHITRSSSTDRSICGRRIPPGKRRVATMHRIQSRFPWSPGGAARRDRLHAAAKAKKNQQLSEGRGVKGCQNSDNLIERVDTKKELAKIAGVSRWDNAPDTKPFPVEPGRASRKRHNAARKRPHRPLTSRAARPDSGP